MSKLIIHLLLVAIMTPATTIINADKEVYICNGPHSKRYHYHKHCRGLSKCSTYIYKVSLEEAKEEGRTLCGWED
ncbi:hypothetical protein [Aquimarina aquimarini]|uniref:hypothetical protein n=1 Tax=Aquimarina aquimarini TaxID=1191734 RepID=UPI001F169F84|nr:hypothetical protein [Aquimarina aquimarini]